MEIRNERQTLAVENANLSGSAFRNVDLSATSFVDANLSRAAFTDINLAGAKFSNINFGGAEVSDCNVDGMTIDGIPVQAALDAYRKSISAARPAQPASPPDAAAHIRPFRASDEPAVTALWKSVFAYSAAHNDPARMIRQKLAVDPDLLLVAIRDGHLVGTIMGGYDGHRGWIYSLAVDSGHRRRGIARALVGFVERALAGRGCPKVNLQVLASNMDAVPFYEEVGYRVEERISMGKLL